MRRSAPASVLAALLLATGCHAAGGSAAGGSAQVPAGKSAETIGVDGHQRTFHLYRPKTLPAAAPLVVMLHGGFGSGTQAERSYEWDTEADKAGFLVAYPDGIDRAWSVGGGCCGAPGRTAVNDVAFISQMVSAIGRRVHLDPARLYATGISNGGMMAYRLACQTQLFAAIGPDSATMLGNCPQPAPISVIHIHGTADHNIPYNGGRGTGYAHIDGPAVPTVNATWRMTDQCATPQITQRAPVTTSIAACPASRSVELITIADAGHQWPGAPAKPLIQRLLGTDPPSRAIDATSVVWSFFAAHPKT